MSATATSDSVCAVVTAPCTAGTYESAAPTGTSDRTCTPCGAGEYQDEDFGLSCKTQTMCTDGVSFENEPATPTSARVCGDCSTCDEGAGEFEGDGGACTALVDRNCTTCGDGFHRDAAAKACVTCVECTDSEYLASACTATQPSVCVACPSGKYLNNPSATTAEDACGDHPVCQAGEFEFAAPTPSAPRECRAHSSCPPGTAFEVRDGTLFKDRVCAKLTECGVGEFEQAAPTATSDRRCVECNGNTEYQDEAGQGTCKTTATCDVAKDQYEMIAPTSSSNRQCSLYRWVMRPELHLAF